MGNFNEAMKKEIDHTVRLCMKLEGQSDFEQSMLRINQLYNELNAELIHLQYSLRLVQCVTDSKTEKSEPSAN